MRTGIPILAAAMALTVFMSSLVLESMDTRGTEASIRTLRLEVGNEAEVAPDLQADPATPRQATAGAAGGDSERAAELIERAQAFYDGGNVRGAYELYRAALELDSGNGDVLLAAGSCCMSMGRPAEAEAFFRQVAHATPSLEAVGLKHVAYAQLRQRKFGPALATLKHVLSESPYDPVVHFELACLYASLMEPERSLFHLDVAHDLLGPEIMAYMSDPHLDTLRHRREFKAIVRAARAERMVRAEPAPPSEPSPPVADDAGQ